MANDSSKRRLFSSDNVTIFLAELFGTALLVFMGCSSCLSWYENATPDVLRIILSFGMAVLIIVQTFGCVSGAHVNPVVTAAAFIYNLIDIKVINCHTSIANHYII